ncbi:MAG: hypothetical protein KKF56_05150 [Nanoarchaeota archaeon]|nr:hypothetical protein [Nanoarchaeota archaeon]
MRLITETHTYFSLKDEYGKVRNEQYLILGKCISNDSQIDTPKGKLKIGDLNHNQTFSVYSYNLDKKRKEIDLATKIKSGKKEVFEIETESGKKIKASKDHIFFVKKGNSIEETKLSHIKEGDLILVK